MESKKTIIKAIESLVGGGVEFGVDTPQIESYGDYSTNVAMVLFSNKDEIPGRASLAQDDKAILNLDSQNSKLAQDDRVSDEIKSILSNIKSPRELAEVIKEKLSKDINLQRYISRIEVAGPGFINFWLREKFLTEELRVVIEKHDSYGKLELTKRKKVVVEYTDPNPFKEFHIGHLYSNSVGESIARLKEAAGAEVWRADYFGDVGMHVSKSIWGLLKKFDDEEKSIDDLETLPLKERIEYLGQAYALGATAYKEDEKAKEEMKELNFVIFASAQSFLMEERGWEPVVDYKKYIKGQKYSLDEIEQIYKKGRAWSLEYFETIYKRLGTKFDGYYPESVAGEYGYKFVMGGLEKGILEKGEGGAVIFPGEKYGLHNRVFINSLGLPTYEAKELGLAPAKYEDVKYDESVIVTGNEINEYFKVLLCALNEINPDLGKKTNHIGHGMVKLPEGKMSSRTGKIIRGEWLLDESAKKIKEILDKSNSISNDEREQISEMVGVGAVKYALLKQGIGADIAFDFDKSLAFEGNSGPYIQYTYARTLSVLRKSDYQMSLLRLKLRKGTAGIRDRISDVGSGGLKDEQSEIRKAEDQELNTDKLKFNTEELALLRAFPKFPEIVAEAAENYAPNIVCNYLYDLASKYNAFYNKHKIIQKSENQISDIRDQNSEAGYQKSEARDLRSDFRLALTSATGQIIKNGLHLVGIQAPERM